MNVNPETVLFIFIGYSMFSMSSSNVTKQPNKFDTFVSEYLDCEFSTSLRWKGEIMEIHIHHWIICLGLYLWFNHLGLYRLSLVALGGFIQGIVRYNDWFEIVQVKY